MSRTELLQINFEVPAFSIAPSSIVTASSYLIDRFVPDCEVISLPSKVTPGGSLRYGFGALPEAQQKPASRTRIKRWMKRRLQRRRILESSEPQVIDFRPKHPQNWSHFLNGSLPLYFHIAQELHRGWSDLSIVLPAKTPPYIRHVAELFGLRALLTDDLLVGEGVFYELEHANVTRPLSHIWVRSPEVQAAVDRIVATGTVEIPQRVFLSRRDSRRVSNLAEVEAFLSGYGFVTIYPEQLSPGDQFRLFRDADTIVAIHGAGLAPLLYRPEEARLRQIVEIMPCGHMTDFYREMAQQVCCSWIGVRGRIKSKYIRPAYMTSTRGFTRYSLDNFEVDPLALAKAFELADHPITPLSP